MVRRFPTSAVIAALVVTASACSNAPSTAPPTHGMAPMSPGAPASTPAAPVAGTAVSIDNFAFAPAMLTVHRGDTVTWTNHDEEPHTVAAEDGSFRSPGMDTNATFSFTFANPGSYDYVCSIHPVMHGTVVVTP
ncbi:cupredoxin domain-containing protein [Mycolicibacterium septicum]|uniref:cupredoxin domain-containing protein n=1 Tax=Mycolicibacterium septicum TaxID=98668 RepID=UPI001AF22BFA|nr:cupredoxin family copper-binding protein [Mycolicibacterium septicum]QRY54250.1 cupredoxin family copper-binding protein [Mycolicibacterium septicum]